MNSGYRIVWSAAKQHQGQWGMQAVKESSSVRVFCSNKARAVALIPFFRKQEAANQAADARSWVRYTLKSS